MAEEGDKVVGRKKFGGARRRLTVAHAIESSEAIEAEAAKAQPEVDLQDGASPGGVAGRRGSTRTMMMHPALRASMSTGDGTGSCSIQGELTSKDLFLPFFADKAINFSGLETMKSLSLGVVCHRGQKPEMCNQDDFFFLATGGVLIYGVLDGHGKEGEQISHFAQVHLPEFLIDNGVEGLVGEGVDVESKITEAFTKTQELIQKELPDQSNQSGCTATVVIQCPKRGTVWAASLGDSTAVIARRPKGQKGQFKSEHLTMDHKPNRPDEKERILANGGDVGEPLEPGLPYRLVTPEAGLAVSRALGDCCASRYGLSAIPEIHSFPIDDEKEDYFILACSDGVWEFLNMAQVVQMMSKFDPSDAQSAADKLAHKAQLRWQEQESVVDDITVILVHGGYDINAVGAAEKITKVGDKIEVERKDNSDEVKPEGGS